MPSHAPSAEQWSGVACVSGPRTVRNVWLFCLVTTISQWLAATERNEPARSLCARQIRSTNGESEGLSSKVKSMHVPPGSRRCDGIVLWLEVVRACHFIPYSEQHPLSAALHGCRRVL